VGTIHCLKNPFLCICLCCTTTSQRPGPGPPHACRSIATHAKSAVHVLCRTSKSPCLPQPHCCFPIQDDVRTSPAPEAWSPHHRPTSVKVKPRPTLRTLEKSMQAGRRPILRCMAHLCIVLESTSCTRLLRSRPAGCGEPIEKERWRSEINLSQYAVI
jgi:hypothetical protein